MLSNFENKTFPYHKLLIQGSHVAEATPKTVMRLLGIPGLTLYHLKSHLQVKSTNAHSKMVIIILIIVTTTVVIFFLGHIQRFYVRSLETIFKPFPCRSTGLARIYKDKLI